MGGAQPPARGPRAVPRPRVHLHARHRRGALGHGLGRAHVRRHRALHRLPRRGQRRDRAQALRGEDPRAGRVRLPHRAAEPQPARRALRVRGAQRPAHASADGAALHRPRPLQDGERPARPRHGRQAAEADRHAPHAPGARHGHGVPPRRRRVPRAAARGRRARERRAHRARDPGRALQALHHRRLRAHRDALHRHQLPSRRRQRACRC